MSKRIPPVSAQKSNSDDVECDFFISEPDSSYVPVCEFEIHMCIYIDFEYIHI